MSQRPDPRLLQRIQLSHCPLPSIGGLILDMTVSNPDYEGMAVFTPVINGEKLLKIISTWLSCMDRLTGSVMVLIMSFPSSL